MSVCHSDANLRDLIRKNIDILAEKLGSDGSLFANNHLDFKPSEIDSVRNTQPLESARNTILDKVLDNCENNEDFKNHLKEMCKNENRMDLVRELENINETKNMIKLIASKVLTEVSYENLCGKALGNREIATDIFNRSKYNLPTNELNLKLLEKFFQKQNGEDIKNGNIFKYIIKSLKDFGKTKLANNMETHYNNVFHNENVTTNRDVDIIDSQIRTSEIENHVEQESKNTEDTDKISQDSEVEDDETDKKSKNPEETDKISQDSKLGDDETDKNLESNLMVQNLSLDNATTEKKDFKESTEIKTTQGFLPKDEKPKQSDTKSKTLKYKIKPWDSKEKEIIKDWSGMTDEEQKKMKDMEEKTELIGQKLAKQMIISSVNNEINHRSPKTLLLLGPSGVGKTTLAKYICCMNSDEKPKCFKRLDMNDFQNESKVSRFTGSAPGFIGCDKGGELTNFLKENSSSSVVLFDEIDKAHIDIVNPLLQLFDEGHIATSTGDVIQVDCKNTIFVMTTNLGIEEICKNADTLRNQETISEDLDIKLRKIIAKHFKKEAFVSRIQEFIPFLPLTKEEIEQFIRLKLENIVKKYDQNKFEISYGDDVVHFIASHYNEDYGIRPLYKPLNKAENSLAKIIEERKKHVIPLGKKDEIQIVICDMV